MATSLKNLSDYNPDEIPQADHMKIGIVVSDYNNDITFELLKGAADTLEKHGVKADNISVSHVPGAYELPFGTQCMFEQHSPDAVINLGCVITGETKHDEYINRSVSAALMQLGLFYKRPVIFGVLTPMTHEQAKDRAGGKHGNKGVEAAITAIKMIHLKEQGKPKSGVGFK